MSIDKPSPNRKLFATLLAGERGQAKKLRSVVTSVRTELAIAFGHITSLGEKCLSALLAYPFNLVVPECPIALARTKRMFLCVGLVRRAMHWLATHLTRVIPAGIGASSRAEMGFASQNGISASEKCLATSLAGSLDLGSLGNGHAAAGAELAMSSWGSFKRLAADQTAVKHGVSSVRDNIRIQSGHRVRRPGLSASDRLALAHTKYTRSILQMQGANDE